LNVANISFVLECILASNFYFSDGFKIFKWCIFVVMMVHQLSDNIFMFKETKVCARMFVCSYQSLCPCNAHTYVGDIFLSPWVEFFCLYVDSILLAVKV